MGNTLHFHMTLRISQKRLLTTQKMNLFFRVFCNKYEQTPSKLWFCSHTLKRSLMKNFIISGMVFLEATDRKISENGLK